MSNTTGARATTQRFTALISPHALLILLPDPITCFTAASYSQTQTFRLEDPNASLVLLDWFTSGRMARGEQWDFERYRSVNEIWLGKRRIARDIMLLEQPSPTALPIPLPERPLKDRLAPYACYATLFLFGPLVQPCIASLRPAYDAISQMQAPQPAPLIWSLTSLQGGVVLRVAGKETELVRNWLRGALSGMKDVIGVDAYNTAFTT